MYSNKYDKIIGMWTGKTYTLLKRLGSGGIGEIYLVENEKGCLLALKLSEDMISITKEYNFLSRLKHKNFIPRVFDLDDFKSQGKIYHYFTMEYIEGYDLKAGLRKSALDLKTKLDMMGIITNIIKQINELGYIYTDLKHENIMIDGRNKLIKLIDLGSLAEIGSTVREYTPMYDRLCWGKGRRVADLSYQMFVMAIFFISMLLNKGLDPDKDELEQTMKSLKKRKVPVRIFEIIAGCIDGRIRDCDRLQHEVCCAAENCNRKPDKLKLALNVLISVLSVIITITIFAAK
jgi:serine/threonine-protein kinase